MLLVAVDAPGGITQVAEGPLPTAMPELLNTWKVTAEEAVPPVIRA